MKLIPRRLLLLILPFLISSTGPAAAAPVDVASLLDVPADVPRLTPVEVTVQPVGKVDSNRLVGFPVNVLQDCWTNDDPTDLEMETYTFPPGVVLNFVWKHKIFDVPCNDYLATIVLTHCQDGKVPIGGNIAAIIPDIPIGSVGPGGEWLITARVPGIGAGVYDWFVVVECNDSNGTIPAGADLDIDDVVGANLGLPPNNPLGPVVYGPEPIEILDPAPGGFPPGRWAGEEGATRCWCFEIN